MNYEIFIHHFTAFSVGCGAPWRMSSVLKIVGQNAVLSGQDSVLRYERGRFSSFVVSHSGMLNPFVNN
jgi:hypothetical protein